ncbi:hypothetical protein ACVWYH_009039 [Bradyrhizobium sp. GM24.11]
MPTPPHPLPFSVVDNEAAHKPYEAPEAFGTGPAYRAQRQLFSRPQQGRLKLFLLLFPAGVLDLRPSFQRLALGSPDRLFPLALGGQHPSFRG